MRDVIVMEIGMKKNSLIAIAVMFFGFVSSATAHAEDWVYLSKTTTGSKWFYQSDTIYRTANQVTVWQKIDHSQDRKYKERETILLSRYDCSAKTRTDIKFNIIYPSGINEQYDFSANEQKTEKISSGSISEFVFKKMCNLAIP